MVNSSIRLTLYIAVSSSEEVRRAEQLADDLTKAKPLQREGLPGLPRGLQVALSTRT
jgi:hypothetical protein